MGKYIYKHYVNEWTRLVAKKKDVSKYKNNKKPNATRESCVWLNIYILYEHGIILAKAIIQYH